MLTHIMNQEKKSHKLTYLNILFTTKLFKCVCGGGRGMVIEEGEKYLLQCQQTLTFHKIKKKY